MPPKELFAAKKPLTQRYFITETVFGDSLLTELNALLKTDAKVISSEGLTEAEAEKSIKKTDFSTLFASLTTVEMTSFQQSMSQTKGNRHI